MQMFHNVYFGTNAIVYEWHAPQLTCNARGTLERDGRERGRETERWRDGGGGRDETERGRDGGGGTDETEGER